MRSIRFVRSCCPSFASRCLSVDTLHNLCDEVGIPLPGMFVKGSQYKMKLPYLGCLCACVSSQLILAPDLCFRSVTEWKDATPPQTTVLLQSGIVTIAVLQIGRAHV